MHSFNKKVAYLQGLSKGLDLKESTAEGKILLGIVDALDSFAGEVETLYAAQNELQDYIETMDEDLSNVEDMIFEEEIVDTIDVKCPHCHATIECLATVQDSEEVEVSCPKCGKIMYYKTELLDHLADGGQDVQSYQHKVQPGI